LRSACNLAPTAFGKLANTAATAGFGAAEGRSGRPFATRLFEGRALDEFAFEEFDIALHRIGVGAH
jgi:hypothetical protein